MDGASGSSTASPVEGTFRPIQVPLANLAGEPEHLRQLETWMRSYRPEELFDDAGRLRSDIAALAPDGDRRMGASPYANGGRILRDLDLPDFRALRSRAELAPVRPGARKATRARGNVGRATSCAPTTRPLPGSWGPDETVSNRLGAVLNVTDRSGLSRETEAGDDHLAVDGRVMEVLSEHMCEGWLEGYLLTGRHGLFNCYEAGSIHIIDSMFNQHAKWLKVTAGIPWRRPIASLNILLSSHVWRQDHTRLRNTRTRLHRPRGQQDGRGAWRVPPARHQLPSVGRRLLPRVAANVST